LLILVGGLIARCLGRPRPDPGRVRRWALLVQAIAYAVTVVTMIAAGEHPNTTVNAVGLIWPLSALGTALACAPAPTALAGRPGYLTHAWRGPGTRTRPLRRGRS